MSRSRYLPLLFAVLFALAAVAFSRPLPVRAESLPVASGSFSPATIAPGGTTTLTIKLAHTGSYPFEATVSGPPGSELVSQSTTCTPRVPLEECTFTLVWTFATPGTYGADDFNVAFGLFPVFPLDGVDFTLEVLGATPAVCALTPDLAVSPQLITIAPGQQATVELAMRNLCKDSLTVPGDLVISFSDGLTVVGGTNGMSGIAPQRAAVQTFTLNGDETRRWTVTVEAGKDLIAAPVHVTEYYTLGRVASRIDGVFITPPPAPAVVEPAPAPAPIPAALPNTAGETAPAAAGLPLFALLLTIAAGALALRRKA